MIEHWQEQIRHLNTQKGWRNPDGTHKNSFGELVALLHEEVSEILSAYRSNGTRDMTEVRSDILPKPEGVGSECADVFIRLLDLCDVAGIDLVGELERKMQYNWTRPYRHGGKAL
jgi:NTP pyrophosphatase (non-canonical NTP hydrolase)